MKYLATFMSIVLIAFSASAQTQHDTWPKTINAQDGSEIKIYEPEPESFSGNILKTRSAISLLAPNATDPIFGTFWAIETVETDRDNRNLTIVSAKIPNIKFASEQDAATIASLKTTLESQISQMGIVLPMDELLTTLDQNTEEKKLSKGLATTPPKIIYTDQPSILVLIDGTPQFQRNTAWGLDAVVNTPFTIIKNNDGNIYLYGGKKWYSAKTVTGPYRFVADPPSNLDKVQTDVDNADNTDAAYTTSSTQNTTSTTDIAATIIIATTPTELVQSDGTPVLTTIDGTNLSYVANSENDIFFNQGDGQYYVLLSGRWYKSNSLQSGWQYTASNALPADFAKIPEGSPKDNVLASIAGTDAAREAIIDAQIPQTAKVDRQSATTSVNYDGAPQFENIEGTKMQYATNTQNSVIFSNGRYYDVDNGVWFESNTSTGPWTVCVDRPDEVDLIPASYPVYNMKYVYIYDVQPNWVYMGYTPGYLNTFIYGPTVVYGTGYYYKPWRGSYYIPRPSTWGFSMHYNPFAGWSIGFDYRTNWFHSGFGATANRGWNGWRGGWFGPAVYHPPFRGNPIRTTGYYGARPQNFNRGANGNPNSNRMMTNRNNNIYNFRRDVTTVNNNRNYTGNRQNGNQQPNGGNGNQQPNRTFNNNNQPNNGNANQQPNRTFNGNGNNQTGRTNQPQQPNRPMQVPANSDITTDRAGNVYQRNNGGNNTVNNGGNNPNNNSGNRPTPNNQTPRTNTMPQNNQTPQANPTSQQNNSNNQNQWQQRQQGQWKPVANPQTNQNLNRQEQQHDRGQARVQNFQSSTPAQAPIRQATPAPARQATPAPQQSRPANPQQQRGNDRRN